LRQVVADPGIRNLADLATNSRRYRQITSVLLLSAMRLSLHLQSGSENENT